MSTALKYRVEITPSRWRNYQWIFPSLIIWGGLHSLSDNTYSWVAIEYFSFIACVSTLFFYWQHLQQAALLPETYLLGDDGSWQQTMSGIISVEGSREVLSGKSRVTPFAVFLCFSTQSPPRWILKGECDEQNYRRLCRIVLQRANLAQDEP
ncbi:protein YgfX [Alteromonas sp. ASW11-130]|uniref:protein YgfX n=1 Tax=Alteromonas sp. ASW11-130 TaxID=3015775 RepID=UPI002241C0E4|nr:protein YgfX [Alteromonas sp. ASW11-130]MCW8092908.1 hypothetical protein [Alteromonas sp. ASW11-130]